MVKLKEISELEKIIACPYDHSGLVREEMVYRCPICTKTYPFKEGTINFLAYEKNFSELTYNIPWHPIPKYGYRSRAISALRALPIYPRLMITGDFFSMYLEYLIYRTSKNHKRVLDIGCRDGANILLSRTSEIRTGIDIDLTAVRFANRISSKRIHAHLGTGTAIPFKNGTFDFVICSEVIEHVVSYPELIENIARVCTPGAEVIITTPNGNVVPAPYQLHHKHFAANELTELFASYFRDLKIISIVRNCKVRQKYWQLHDSKKYGKFLLLPVNFLSNAMYLINGYHKHGSDLRQDVSDANYILTGIRK